MNEKWKAIGAIATAVSGLAALGIYLWPRPQPAKPDYLEKYADASSRLAVCEYRAGEAEKDLQRCESERWELRK